MAKLDLLARDRVSPTLARRSVTARTSKVPLDGCYPLHIPFDKLGVECPDFPLRCDIGAIV